VDDDDDDSVSPRLSARIFRIAPREVTGQFPSSHIAALAD
jgi:hypothetical protein